VKQIVKRLVNIIIERLVLIRGNINRNDNFSGLFRAWGFIYSNHIEGDYVEFGVYRGDSVINSLKCHQEFDYWLKNQKISKEEWRREVANQSPLSKFPKFHCLDTFEGMPDNDEGAIQFAKNTFNSSLDMVIKRVSKENKLSIEVNFYKGLFDKNIDKFNKQLENRKIAIANIDCDLKESTTDALNMIQDKIDIGTVLLFDDYYSFSGDNNKGQKLAFREFCDKSQFIFEKFYTYQYMGQSFLIVGKD